jgi:pyruvate dehydrogenase E1 component alpha subunit
VTRSIHLKMLLSAANATEDELKAIDTEIKAIVAEAVQFAQESPEPDPSELYTDVYVEA